MTAGATARRMNDANTSIAPHHMKGENYGECTPCQQSSIIASSCLIAFDFLCPGSGLDGIVEPEYIGLITLSKINSTGHLFVWYPPLPVDRSHIHVGQFKQMLDMLPLIGVPPAPGYKKYVPQDSLMKRMHDAAHQQGYSVNRSDCSDDNHHINQGNHITRPTQKYFSAVIESVSLQLLANHRGPFSKSNKYNNRRDISANLDTIQRGLGNYIVSECPSLKQVMPSTLETDISKIFNKRIHINNLIKKGVYTGWDDFRGHPCGLWVGQWFLWTFLTQEHRRTVEEFPTPRSLKTPVEKGVLPILPKVLNSGNNPPLSEFIEHVCAGVEIDEIRDPARHNALQWKVMPVPPEAVPGCESCFDVIATDHNM